MDGGYIGAMAANGQGLRGAHRACCVADKAACHEALRARPMEWHSSFRGEADVIPSLPWSDDDMYGL